MTDEKNKMITMHDLPFKKTPQKPPSKPITTHDVFHPKPEYRIDEKGKPIFDGPRGPFITMRDVDSIKAAASQRSKMEKVRAAKLDKIKEDLQAQRAAEEPKPEKAKKEKKAKPAPEPQPEEKKEPESPPEPISEPPKASDIPKNTAKRDPLTEAVEKETKKKTTAKRGEK